MLALSDVELALIGKAFDRAWDRYLRAGLLTPHNLTESRHLLAARILRCHRYGERDEWRLARDAVTYIRQLRRQSEPMILLPAAKKRTPATRKSVMVVPPVQVPVPDVIPPPPGLEERP
jgi:hypothetical protein